MCLDYNWGGIGLITTGFVISADANGLFSGGWNMTRMANSAIDVVTSAVPYGKIFGKIEK
ncbi:hypothetical protein [Methanosphaera sp. WGK6]|uniref:hypothetical protein n=1 Tax=Methanosphaera sp. WGK6 TaxID=1561964 RepID=UPI00084C757D|nr:hypothetical protein [Methanosphaera sp. WGK6]OED30789.1 hypothetical protein NL43_00250 [Methanosphaera sp. WGK6]